MKALISKMKEKNTLARIIVDEAYCVDTDIWGIDFRPSYSKLHIFKECEIPMVAFTGTFTGTAERTVPTIIERQKLVNPRSLKCHWTGQMKSNVQSN